MKILVVPAAPVLLPGAQVTPDGIAEVLAACDEVLAPAVRNADEVITVSCAEQMRDLADGSAPRSRAAAVADHLLDRAGFDGVRRHLGPLDSMDGAEVCLFMADGSASVGPKAPRPNPAGEPFDDRLWQVLESGELEHLSAVTDGEALAVGCVTAPVWRRLGEWCGAARCESLVTFAPYGVRYFVGSWTKTADTR